MNTVFTLIPFLPETNVLRFCQAPVPQNQPRLPAPFATEISGPLPALIAASDFAISTLPTDLTSRPGLAFSIRAIAAFQSAKLPPLYGDQTVTVRVAACAVLVPTIALTSSPRMANEAINRFFIINSLEIGPHSAPRICNETYRFVLGTLTLLWPKVKDVGRGNECEDADARGSSCIGSRPAFSGSHIQTLGLQYSSTFGNARISSLFQLRSLGW